MDTKEVLRKAADVLEEDTTHCIWSAIDNVLQRGNSRYVNTDPQAVEALRHFVAYQEVPIEIVNVTSIWNWYDEYVELGLDNNAALLRNINKVRRVIQMMREAATTDSPIEVGATPEMVPA